MVVVVKNKALVCISLFGDVAHLWRILGMLRQTEARLNASNEACDKFTPKI